MLALRRATRDDVPAIVRLYADDMLGATREQPDAPEAMAGYYAAFDALAHEVNSELMVALADAEVVGTFQLTFIQHLTRAGGRAAQLEAVRIAGAWRGRGLGAEMMRWAIDRARAAGCSRVQLTSNKQRTDAHRFYARLGFVASHEGMKLYL